MEPGSANYYQGLHSESIEIKQNGVNMYFGGSYLKLHFFNGHPIVSSSSSRSEHLAHITVCSYDFSNLNIFESLKDDY